jgi:hypothetical protein
LLVEQNMEPMLHAHMARKGRSTLVWTLGLFVLGQVAGGLWVHRRHPEYCDPTYQFRLARLRARLAETPGRPLVLVIGSSRVANGFSPSAIDPAGFTGPPPVVFNFATLGAGPVRELLTLRRLLAEGIRPDWVLVEVFAPFWNDHGHYEEHGPILSADIYASDLAVLSKLYGQAWENFPRVVSRSLTPAVHYRGEMLADYFPSLAPRTAQGDIEWSRVHWKTLDDWGWLPVPWGKAPKQILPEHFETARLVTEPELDHLTLTPNTDWCLNSLLGECRRRGIKTAFMLLPESRALRSWYSAAAQATINAALYGYQAEYGTPVIDARDWLTDDGLVDFSHMTPEGGVAFTRRFGRDVLPLLLSGQPLPKHLTPQLSADGYPVTGSPHTPPAAPVAP